MSGWVERQEATLPAMSFASGQIRSGIGSFRTILFATDLSSVSEAAGREALNLCGALGARLLVVNVIDPRGGFGPTRSAAARSLRIDQVRADRERALMEFVGNARSLGIDASFLLWTGEPGHSIVAAADAEKVDLVVVGTRALDRAGRFLLGSVSDYVVNHSPSPVLIAR